MATIAELFYLVIVVLLGRAIGVTILRISSAYQGVLEAKFTSIF